MTDNKEFQELKSILLDNSIDERLRIATVGKFVDLSADLKDVDQAKFAIEFLENLLKNIAPENICEAHYFTGIAYGVVITETISRTEKDWEWEQELTEKELSHLRLAHQNVTSRTDKQIQAFILIQLANRLNNLGRFLLSLDFWNQAIMIFENLGMAFANTGNSLIYYGRNYLNNTKYQICFTQLAYQYLKKSITKPLFPGISEEVKKRIAVLETTYKPALEYGLTRSDFIIDCEPTDYCEWCSLEGLWLNPVSNVNLKIDCNKDDLQLLSVDKEFSDFFNSICQDYIYSRSLFFSTLNVKENAIQEKKSAFREAYSLFDKIAYLLAGIYELDEIDDRRLSFSRIWYLKLNNKTGLSPIFTEKQNLMLRALYWVSKDIYLNEDGFKNIIEPRAKEINSIRNFIEHRSFRFGQQREQNFTLQMPVTEFDDHMLKLLKLVRETLIYTAYSTTSNKA